MNTPRTRWVVAAVFATGLLLGVASVALAAYAYSPERTFFGPVDMGGTYICGKQFSLVDNNPESAAGETSAWHNTSCSSNTVTRPAGQLGSLSFLWKGTSGNGGVLYGDSGWQYNSTASEDVGSAWYCNGACPSGTYYATAEGRIWNSNTGKYITSSFLSYSPNLNF